MGEDCCFSSSIKEMTLNKSWKPCRECKELCYVSEQWKRELCYRCNARAKYHTAKAKKKLSIDIHSSFPSVARVGY